MSDCPHCNALAREGQIPNGYRVFDCGTYERNGEIVWQAPGCAKHAEIKRLFALQGDNLRLNQEVVALRGGLATSRAQVAEIGGDKRA